MSATGVRSSASSATHAKRPKPPRPDSSEPASWADLVPGYAPPPKKRARAAPEPEPAPGPAPQADGPNNNNNDDDEVPMFSPEDFSLGDEIKYRHVLGGVTQSIKDGVVLKVDLHEDEAGGHCTLKVSSDRPGGGKITRTIGLGVVVAHTPQEVDSDDEAEPAEEAAQQAGGDGMYSDSDGDDPDMAGSEDGGDGGDGGDASDDPEVHPDQFSDSEPEEHSDSDSDASLPPPDAEPPAPRNKLVLAGEPSGYNSDHDPDAGRAFSLLKTALQQRPRKHGQKPLVKQGVPQAKQYRGWLAALLKVKSVREEDDEERVEGEEYRPYHNYRTLRIWRIEQGTNKDECDRVRDHIARAFELDRGQIEQAKYVGQTMCALNLLMDASAFNP